MNERHDDAAVVERVLELLRGARFDRFILPPRRVRGKDLETLKPIGGYCPNSAVEPIRYRFMHAEIRHNLLSSYGDRLKSADATLNQTIITKRKQDCKREVKNLTVV